MIDIPPPAAGVERDASNSFPIVGVGASAGGLETFTQLLAEIPPDTGMAFVFIQHLDPTQTSFLAEALTRATKMTVTQAKDGERVEPNHIYVIPPNAEIAILHGVLTLLPRKKEARVLHLPIDYFLRSLAQDRRSHAIGVILSGTASDGTEGLRAIKGEDGITFAQDPKSSKFDGMPRSAIDAGVVDYALPIPELARELIRLSSHPYVSEPEGHPLNTDVTTLNKIYALVRSGVGVDFSEYKSPTFARRLARRMALRKIDDLPSYLEVLQGDPKEVRSLYEDILIHVTSFFRDPEVFESLKANVFPEILKGKAAGDPVRLWVAGCSTGEEVYSLAIALLEHLGDPSRSSHAIQIFGSDISEKAIEKARIGLYPDAALRDVVEERRSRYFTKADIGYRINKTVRDLCVFVRHDLARDPPFSKLDLVSCRNVLIYFDQTLQKRVLPTFHYALNRGGFLLLGHSESIAGFEGVFSPVDKSNKVFRRTAGASALRFAPRSEVHPVAAQLMQRGSSTPTRRSIDVVRPLERMLMAAYVPSGVLINDRMEILHFCGETEGFLRPAPGEPQNNLLKMARDGLISPLRAAVAKAKKSTRPVKVAGLEVEYNGSRKSCDLVVTPFSTPDSTDQLFVVMFEEPRVLAAMKPVETIPLHAETPEEIRRVAKLEREMATTREYLQSLIDERDRTNDDLNAANEELISGNEELQSMNEEMETAKEELQSTNEELSTVNDELHTRNQEIQEINSDLVNILSTVNVPILILDRARNIRRYTPKARSILNVLPSDLGRPLDDIKPNLQLVDLDQRVAEVIETNQMHESEVQDRNGVWYRMQIRPYKTIENKIEGATLSLVDINALKHHLAVAETAKKEAERASDVAERATRAKDEFLATLSHEIRTPLSSMMMQAQLLARGGMDPASVKRAGESIERGTRMQVQLIDDLLDVSRIVTGMVRIEFKPVDLSAVVKAALEGVAAPAERKKLTFEVQLDETVGPVSGDSIRLQQVVANLLTNAVKFSTESAQITVVLNQADGLACLKISDTGSGIEPDFLPHVFNRFAQEDGSTVRRHGGLGLGLAIVRHLVDAHGGTIKGESPGRGKGATFSVVLPLMTSGTETLQEEESRLKGPPLNHELKAAIQRGLLNGLRVLVVDDDLGTREAIADMLGKTGANVRVVASASEAAGAVGEFRPEVLLCDIAMPGEDGYSFIRRVRAMEGGQSLPAAAVTALAGEESRRRALSAGFQMHLVKPVDIDHLAQAVAELSHRASSPAVNIGTGLT